MFTKRSSVAIEINEKTVRHLDSEISHFLDAKHFYKY